ncbi:3'-5' exoribonuclease YhaM family protein [Candidatus Auribacterota bacterium]
MNNLDKINKQFVKNLKVGSRVNSYFKIDTIDRRSKKNGDPFLTLTISDASGVISGVAWDNVETIQREISESRIVFIVGEVGDYSGLQFNVKNVRKCAKDEYQIAALVKTIPNRDKIKEQIQEILFSGNNVWLKKLSEVFLKDESFIDKFMRAPGGWKWHHSYIGGLMRHTYEVMEICQKMCELHPEINRDICLFGAFMHDIGKIFELKYDPVFEYTDRGKLIGHIILGNNFLLDKIKMIPDFPNDLEMELQHILLSHQGEYEQRSPVLPQTLEACVVYHADNLDSQANAVKSVIFGTREKDQTWSKWLTIINRQLKLQEPLDQIF